MHVATGHKINQEMYESLSQAKKREHVQIAPSAEVAEARLASMEGRKNNQRNKPCPCGSGVKFKKCHWNKRLETA